MAAPAAICGAAVAASRERERGSWSGGRAETGPRFPLKETRGAGGRCSHDGAWAQAAVALKCERSGKAGGWGRR
jgi:hypothetical protein